MMTQSGSSPFPKRSTPCASPFRDLSEGRAVNPPRLRYTASTPDATRRYAANIHAGSVESFAVACVRAGSNFMPVQSADGRKVAVSDPANWTIIILYDLNSGEPIAFMHEAYLSGFRVGATTALALSEAAREDASVLGLFGTGQQAFPGCRAICSVRPIKRVQVYSPNPAHRAEFVKRMAGEKFETTAVDDPREVLRGAHIVACCTNSDVINARHEVDETTFARASEIIINDWDSVDANHQVELSGPIAKGLVKRENVHELGDIAAGKVKLRREPDGIIFYKNNTGLAMQFAACGAIIHRKLIAEGSNRTIPTEWFASGKYHI